MKLILAITAVALFAACAEIGTIALKAGTSGASRFTEDDVEAAIAIAQNAKDTVAEACYRAIRKHTGAEPSMVTKGIVSSYAAARVKLHQARAPLAEDVHVACAPLVVDAATFADRLGLTFTGVR